jgi:hypothetical protein
LASSKEPCAQRPPVSHHACDALRRAPRSSLDSLLREAGSRRAQGLALAALWALVSSPGGAVAVATSAVPRSLVAVLRQQQQQPGGGGGGAGGKERERERESNAGGGLGLRRVSTSHGTAAQSGGPDTTLRTLVGGG